MKIRNILRLMIMASVFSTIFSCSAGEKISITGKALNDKESAIVETAEHDYMIAKMEEWSDQVYGKKVIVTGYLQVKTYEKKSTDQVHVQERVGKVYIIKKAKWKLAE